MDNICVAMLPVHLDSLSMLFIGISRRCSLCQVHEEGEYLRNFKILPELGSKRDGFNELVSNVVLIFRQDDITSQR
ncbi:hypothetical protein BgiMline_009636 [Biomphalaria glabrata]